MWIRNKKYFFLIKENNSIWKMMIRLVTGFRYRFEYTISWFDRRKIEMDVLALRYQRRWLHHEGRNDGHCYRGLRVDGKIRQSYIGQRRRTRQSRPNVSSKWEHHILLILGTSLYANNERISLIFSFESSYNLTMNSPWRFTKFNPILSVIR